MWAEIQACVNEGCGAVVGEAPPELPLSLWPPSVDPDAPLTPEFATEEEVTASIFRVCVQRDQSFYALFSGFG